MCSFDLLSIPASSRKEVDEFFEHFTHEFLALGNIRAADVPEIVTKLYHRAASTRRCALACIIDYADFTQYTLCVGQFAGLVTLLQDILKR